MSEGIVGTGGVPLAGKLTATASDFISGARGVKEMIAEALLPDADGIDRISRNELNDILSGYRSSSGGLLDGRSSVESYAGVHKPALLAALEADRKGTGEPWDVYRSTQIGIDMNSSGTTAAPATGGSQPHGDVGSLTWAFGRIVDMLKNGAETPREVNQMGDTVEKLLPTVARGAALSDGDFEAMRAAAGDPTIYTLLSLRLSSINRAPLQYLANNPGMSKAEFVQHLRSGDFASVS